jgi:tetratricopeptide (TPR) repeat protein
MKFKKITLFIVLLNTSLFAQNISEAIKKTENERFNEATKQFNALIAATPINACNYFYAGENYFEKGELDSAVIFWNKTMQADPKSPFSFVGVGKALLMKGDIAGAQSQFALALSMTKNKNSEILRCVAKAYLTAESKNLDEAIRLLNLAIKKTPTDIDCHLLMGDALNYKTPENGSAAIKSYNEVLKINPKSPKGIVRTAKLYQRAKNFRLADSLYKIAKAIDPTYAPSYRENAELNMMFNQSDKAIENWQKYLSLNNSYESRYRYAVALFKGERYCEAIPELLSVKNNAFTNHYIDRMLSYSYYECTTEPDAIKKGLEASELFFATCPSDKIVFMDYKYKGMLLSKNGQDSLAIIEFEKTSNLDQKSAIELAGDLAKLYLKFKNYDSVITKYQYKLANNKLTGGEYYDLGKAYYFGPKNYVAADSAFSNLNKLSSKYVPGYFWRARAQVATDISKINWSASKSYQSVIDLVSKEERNSTKYKAYILESSRYLGDYYVNSPAKDPIKAKECWSIVLELEPEDKQAKVFLGIK